MIGKKNQPDSRGFTIVELLVVIVVIGVLAAITVVSYTGITRKATVASLQSELSNISMRLKLDQVADGDYPENLNLANNDLGINLNPSIDYQYSADNTTSPKSFCMTTTKDNISYKITNDSVAVEGVCPRYLLSLDLDAENDGSYHDGDTNWSDLSDNNLQAALVNGVGYFNVGYKSLIFDGIDDYAIINDSFIVNPTALTISSWFSKTSSNATYNCALHKGNNTTIGTSEYWLGADNSGRLTATIGANTGVGWSAGQTNITAILGDWYNIVATWDGSVVRVYVNGQFNKQYNLSTYSNISAVTRIGASSNGSNYQFPGMIANVQIYERAISSTEVLQNFDELKAIYGL